VHHDEAAVAGVTLADVRKVALPLPRTSEHLIRDVVKFRVKAIVYAAVPPDETMMGVAFPKEERAAMIAADPAKFAMPRGSDERYNWIHVRMAALDRSELRELVVDGWRMCVPKFISDQVD
jgi:hypothetical protein